ncbi:hypothetical protein T265_10601 [Opisthorchis viverrini]|uniref:Uncharacterized protein n=1 Tax=Opisthorchis viverrini TaxID=6198 RepID=A0A074Z1P3_OPIVI|nr:hypothetical protein T265_10601 [Opisthorchis viverrini]KER20971.1 hypothetical protein T265_10601 [Opisthorchis viverrini]
MKIRLRGNTKQGKEFLGVSQSTVDSSNLHIEINSAYALLRAKDHQLSVVTLSQYRLSDRRTKKPDSP